MSFPPCHPALDRALAARGYAEPTPVQSAVLEADAGNADLLVSAQTGSGKTVAFGLALASTLLGDKETFGTAGLPAALIIAPTRELALQISRELEWLYAETGARIITCVGGMSVRHEQNRLAGGAHIVVGTPGRLCDHLSNGHLKLSELKAAVLDEADEMLDLGFRDELETILDATPAERRTLLFSATIARGIAALARNYQRDAVRIDTTSRSEPHGDIEYRAMRISPGDTERAVVNVLRYFESGGALVFCATREAVRHLQASLRERGFHAVGLSGEMGQRERNDALQSLRDGHARVCVATDVAARGLDLPDLSLVIHADLPTNKATLLHRSGRTGRAGRKGVSVLLVTHTRRRRLEGVLASANIEAIWSGPPTAAEIRERDRQRLLDHPALGAVVADEDAAIASEIASRHTPEQLAGALVNLLRTGLPEPENVSEDHRMRDREPSAPRERREYPAAGITDTGGEGVWFRLNVGRRRNADPKWLIPLICRLGDITKQEIGRIRVFDEETKFEIVPNAAATFATAVETASERDMQITPSTAPQARSDSSAPRAPREDREDRPRGERSFGDRPRPERSVGDRPRPERKFGDRPRLERTSEDRPRPERKFGDRPRPERGAERSYDKRPPRDGAHPPRRERAPAAPAPYENDPVLTSLTASERESRPRREHPRPGAQPAPAPSQTLNRRARRDAARAEGSLTDTTTQAGGDAKPAKRWSPDQNDIAAIEAATTQRRFERVVPAARPERAERSGRPARKDGPRHERGHDPDRKPFKPRGAKPFRDKPFGERSATDRPGGDKPFKRKPSSGSSSGKSFGGKSFGGKPFGGPRGEGAPSRQRPGGKPKRNSRG